MTFWCPKFSKKPTKICSNQQNKGQSDLHITILASFKLKCITGKSLSEALLFAEHGENMVCTKIVLNVRNNFGTQHVLPRFELGIFMY